MADQEMIQEKIGEALGLEKAAQKAVEDLDSRGLLQPEQMKKLSKMKEEASQQEEEMQDLVQELVESDGFNQETIDEKAEETAEKAWHDKEDSTQEGTYSYLQSFLGSFHRIDRPCGFFKNEKVLCTLQGENLARWLNMSYFW